MVGMAIGLLFAIRLFIGWPAFLFTQVSEALFQRKVENVIHEAEAFTEGTLSFQGSALLHRLLHLLHRILHKHSYGAIDYGGKKEC